ncbi:hypothetical protein CDV26_10245 [Francisella halioticida]|uniref:GST N-terminal domain-containing protein n=1 Tax=Francisella halioticida TaxID=549298 RepID=A0ABM6M1C3_9GAMM|nr:glutathione S-transferase N-terminal domain-containing protein [Francisella halioticida]ASG68714.1 hypothetical protein CDV26_10245 [Francisella halioticida]
MSVTLYGNRFVIYTKKVLAVLDLKSIPCTLNTETPKEYEKIHPLKQISAIVDDEPVADSSVICAFLDKKYLEGM